ncbi:MarC family protein [Desulfovibrio sp. JC022]|uniref:MarC family protein n=1 Tax=Desulfovibrio sp. JC022 TaxID=2593642 RepID=UPI0013D4F66B|nr:MarC family protein [Desulfovibrio sp. JC022]NDV22810.1 NAAT family transporter [Desulfovibrio sp. JC022]
MEAGQLSTIFEIAFPLFLIMDPLGNLPVCLSMLRDFSPSRQRKILLRELFFALGIIIMFMYLGAGLMKMLNIHQSTLRIAGGVILFIISMKMIFPKPESASEEIEKDPFIVPIAVPLFAGPSLLAAVMVYGSKGDAGMNVLSGVLIAWGMSFIIMMTGPTMARILGKRGLRACERLMGLILILLSVQMLEDGIAYYITNILPR